MFSAFPQLGDHGKKKHVKNKILKVCAEQILKVCAEQNIKGMHRTKYQRFLYKSLYSLQPL